MIKIERSAEDKKAGMTLADLKAFIAEAERAGLADTGKVTAGVGLRGQLQRIGVEG